ncbi:MAG TPA: FecR domain-containing protein [Gemmatimonadaceae bacterium]
MLDIDWELLLRYCERECAPADRERFDRWLDADRKHRAFFDVVALGNGLGPCIDPPPAPSWRAGDRVSRITRVWRGPAHRLGWLVAAAALLAVAAPAAMRLTNHAAAPARRAERTVSTRLGERAIVRLSDGTQVVLAAASTLRYSTAQLAAARDVEVTGEAYFDVAHDTAHPFVVHANGATISDLGTAFDVRAYPTDRHVRVVVAEGRVTIADAHVPRAIGVIERGHLAQVDEQGGVVTRVVDPGPYVAWTTGELVFDATPLADAARDLTRWFGTTVIVRDTALARRDFTGTFDRESLDDALAIIGRTVRARVAWRADTAVLVPLPPH